MKENRFAVIINGKVLNARVQNVLSRFPPRVTAKYVCEGHIARVSEITLMDRKTGKSSGRKLDPPIQLGLGESLEFSERLDRIKESMKDSQSFQVHI